MRWLINYIRSCICKHELDFEDYYVQKGCTVKMVEKQDFVFESCDCENEKIKACPEFPFFGATYPDARCIDGFLWDLDKCDDNGLYSSGYNPPCPFCNTEAFINYYVDEDEEEDIINDEHLTTDEKNELLSGIRKREDIIKLIKNLKDKYG